MRYSYEAAQKEFVSFHNLKEGDTVKILRKAGIGELGWYHWAPSMDKYVGKTGVVCSIRSDKIRVKMGEERWDYPFYVLEKVAEEGAVMSTDYSYEEAQNEFVKFHDLKVGDKVKILRKASVGEMGWELKWDSRMDTTIGKTATVVEMDRLGVMTKEPGSNLWIYPFFVLEKIKEKVSPPETIEWLPALIEEIRLLTQEVMLLRKGRKD